MPTTRPDDARRPQTILLPVVAPLLILLAILGACSQPSVSPTPLPSLMPTHEPTATPEPTPVFSNLADPALVRLIPTEVAGVAVQIPPITDFAITPGDIGAVYGDIGNRFRTLQLAYMARPRLSLFAMRIGPPFPTTADLKPYLAEAGRYVGIAGLHSEPWTLQTIANRVVWVRPEDNATLKGTRVYTWAAEGFVFLMIGVNEAQNLAMLGGLPGEPAPTPTLVPSPSQRQSGAPSASAG
jgi:hypothetical protein